MKKLESLTAEQQSLMLQVRDEWMEKIFHPEKRLKLNKKEAEKGIRWMYKLSKLKEPKHIIFVESPVGLQMCVWVLEGLKKKLGASVWDSVRASVWASVWDSVRASVWDSVGDSVRDSVGDSVGDRYTATSYYGNIGDYGWCSFFDFFKRIGILKNENFDAFLNLLNSGVYDMILFENIAIVCPMPSGIHRTEFNGQMRLHHKERFAIEWPDGYGQNYLWGIFFPDNLWQKVQKKNPKDILALENMEQRMAALKFMGPETLLDSAEAVKVGGPTKKGNELYVVPKGKIFDEDEFFLKYSCPSTGRIYVKAVLPAIGRQHDPDFAQASTFAYPMPKGEGVEIRTLTKEEYLSISSEA